MAVRWIYDRTNLFDVSNSNTPGVIDQTNPVQSQYYRTVAEVDADGRIPRHGWKRLQRE